MVPSIRDEQEHLSNTMPEFTVAEASAKVMTVEDLRDMFRRNTIARSSSSMNLTKIVQSDHRPGLLQSARSNSTRYLPSVYRTSSHKGNSADGMTDTKESPKDFIKSLVPHRLVGLSTGPHPSAASAKDTKLQRTRYTAAKVNAIRNNDLNLLRQIMGKEGSNAFDACNTNGETLLHLACRRSHVDTIRFLLVEASCNWNIKDNMGRNIFHDCCWRPDGNQPSGIAVVDLLLSFKSGSMIPLLFAHDLRGHVPLDYIPQESWESWKRLMLQRRTLLSGTMKQDDEDDDSSTESSGSESSSECDSSDWCSEQDDVTQTITSKNSHLMTTKSQNTKEVRRRVDKPSTSESVPKVVGTYSQRGLSVFSKKESSDCDDYKTEYFFL